MTFAEQFPELSEGQRKWLYREIEATVDKIKVSDSEKLHVIGAELFLFEMSQWIFGGSNVV